MKTVRTLLPIGLLLLLMIIVMSCSQSPTERLKSIDIKSFDVAEARTPEGARKVETTLRAVPGVTAVTVNASTGLAAVSFETETLKPEVLQAALATKHGQTSLHVFPEVKGGGKCPIPHEMFNWRNWF